jgi:hypothetical protein
MARATSTLEPAAYLFATYGSPTRDQVGRDGSPYVFDPDLPEPPTLLATFLKLADDHDRVHKMIDNYGGPEYGHWEKVRYESRRRAGLETNVAVVDGRRREITHPGELQALLPIHPQVARAEIYWAFLQLEDQARRLVDQAAAAAKHQADYVQTKTCQGCGQVDAHTDRVQVIEYAGAPRTQLCPDCLNADRVRRGIAQLALTHTDGRAVGAHLDESAGQR